MALFEKIKQFLVSEETSRVIAKTQADVTRIDTDIKMITQSLSFTNLGLPTIDLKNLANTAKNRSDEELAPILNLTKVYAKQLKKAGTNGQELVANITIAKTKSADILSRFNDFNRAEGKLTKLLAQKSKGGRTTYDIFEKHMGNLGDKDKEEYLRSKFARATSPLRAIAKDNDALIADLNTTLSTTIEKLNALKKKSPELKDFDEICKKCQKLNPEAVSKKTLVDNLNLLSEYTKKYTAAQNKLRSWRDEIYPVLLEAEKHLETDLITVNRLSGDYERIKKDLRIVFKETTTYLRESGKIQKGKNARKAIDNEIKEIAKRLKKISDMNESATKILTKKPTSAGIGAAFDLNFEKKSFSYGKDTMVCKHDLMANEIANHHKLLIEKLKLQAEMAGKKDKYDIKAELIEYTEKITPLSQDLYDNIRDFTRNTFYQMARQILRSDTHNLGSEALRARENLWRLKDRESNIKDLIKNYKKAMDSELIKLNNYLKILEEEKLLILNNIDSIYK